MIGRQLRSRGVVFCLECLTCSPSTFVEANWLCSLQTRRFSKKDVGQQHVASFGRRDGQQLHAKAGEVNATLGEASVNVTSTSRGHARGANIDFENEVAAFTKEISSMVCKPSKAFVKLSDFPYYLGAETQERLLSTAFAHMKKSSFSKHKHQLPSINNSVLLCGPHGSELYQEELVRALAAELHCRILVFDHEAILPKLESARESEELKSLVHSPGAQEDEDGNENEDEVDALEELLKINGKKDSYTTFNKGDRVLYVGSRKQLNITQFLEDKKSNDPPVGLRGQVVDKTAGKLTVRFDFKFPGGSLVNGEEKCGSICKGPQLRPETKHEQRQSTAMDALFGVIKELAAQEPLIVFIKEVQKYVLRDVHQFLQFSHHIKRLPDNVILVGSYASKGLKSAEDKNGTSMFGVMIKLHMMMKHQDTGDKSLKHLQKLLPNVVDVQLPAPKTAEHQMWKLMMKDHLKKLQEAANRRILHDVMLRYGILCSNAESLPLADLALSVEDAECVVGWAATRQLMTRQKNIAVTKDIVIQHDVMCSTIELMRQRLEGAAKQKGGAALKHVQTDNEFERQLLSEVVGADEVGVGFEDIGALEEPKQALRELVSLPLQRPDLFHRGALTRPTKGVLLFGPPGTGKTMLAKAAAAECGANFINVTMSTVLSKWYGDAEKYVKAVFSLAQKIAPCVIFVDEVESMLGHRGEDRDTMRRVKNEFMTHWDGLRSSSQRITVLAATNRPMDLDDAVIRRLSRRIFVDLPDKENRAKILQVILKHEELDSSFNMDEVVWLTEGYSGSDLHNLCVAAAYRPVRDYLQTEDPAPTSASAGDGVLESGAHEEDFPQLPHHNRSVKLRPLTLADFRMATKQVSPSVARDGDLLRQLRQWNQQFGEIAESEKRRTPVIRLDL